MSHLSYEVWTDADGKLHDISKMDEQYIKNCLNQLNLMQNTWRSVTFSDLTKNDKKLADEVGQKAWFVEHGKNFINAFEKELIKRQETKQL